MPHDIQKEIDQNFEAFEKILPELIKQQRGQYVLMRKQKPVEFFNTIQDAIEYGDAQFEDSLFSVQKIKQKPEDLGWLSHVPLRSTV